MWLFAKFKFKRLGKFESDPGPRPEMLLLAKFNVVNDDELIFNELTSIAPALFDKSNVVSLVNFGKLIACINAVMTDISEAPAMRPDIFSVVIPVMMPNRFWKLRNSAPFFCPGLYVAPPIF